MLGCGEEPAQPAGGGDAKATGAPDLSDKADGALEIREAGRMLDDGRREARLDGGVQAWRIRSFGGTKIRIRLTAPDGDVDPYLVVQGPLPEGLDRIVAHNDDAGEDTFDSALDVTLDAPGAYRVLAGSYGQFHQRTATPGRVVLDFACLEHCAPPEMGLDELLSALRAEVGEAALRDLLDQGIPALFPDADTAATVRAQVDAFLAGAAGGPFPVVPLDLAGRAQGLFEAPGDPVPEPAPVEFRLDELLTKGCAPERATLEPVHPAIPGLMRGSPPDYTIDDCTLQRARDFANVLDNLSLDNGSAVLTGDRRIETVEEAFVALIESGHRVRVENSRYFADFLGLWYRGAAVRAPVWLDTGIPLDDGETLKIPAPHTHHTIHVEGPLLNATVMYYMGVSGGVSFRAVESPRAPWTGERVLYTYDSADDPDAVVRLMDTAARLRRKWFAEGKDLPALGYGRLGVCNDSTAVLELAVEGTVTIFPLAHPPLDTPPRDAIDALLARLPSDLHAFDPAEALTRIRTTLPFEDPSDLPFPTLRAQLAGR